MDALFAALQTRGHAAARVPDIDPFFVTDAPFEDVMTAIRALGTCGRRVNQPNDGSMSVMVSSSGASSIWEAFSMMSRTLSSMDRAFSNNSVRGISNRSNRPPPPRQALRLERLDTSGWPPTAGL